MRIHDTWNLIFFRDGHIHRMVDDSINIHEQFPVPMKGIPILCSVNFEAGFAIPIIYFGRETFASGREIPESPDPLISRDSSNKRPSSNPLNSIIRKWEAQFALQGGVMESGDYVASKGRGDDRYYHADEWLDDGDEEEGDQGEYIGEVDLDAFRVITPDTVEEEEPETADSDGTDDEEEDNMDDVGGNWQLLIRRLDSGKQAVVKELVSELESFQAFPGHTKQKKQKALKDSTARLRRLLPKVNQIQSQWQAAVWAVVAATNEHVNMQAFMELWNDVAPNKQKEEIVKERDETVEKCSEFLREISAVWKLGESLQRSRNELAFSQLVRVWELWIQEEECAGRITPPLTPARSISKIEKRFAASLSELVPDLPSDVVPLLLRVAVFGVKKTSTKKPMTELPAGSDEDEKISESTEIPMVSLPATVFIYRRNELLKCKLTELKSLSLQLIQIADKDWDGSDTVPEFQSFDALFESYQQKFVRKQDRVVLPSPYEAWKYFAIKQANGEYITLYDLAQRASAAHHFAFTDKTGIPVFLPSIASARSADVERRKKLHDVKDERKRKREALEAKAKEQQSKFPPFNETFIPFPDFSKDLFAPDPIGGNPGLLDEDSRAPVVIATVDLT